MRTWGTRVGLAICLCSGSTMASAQEADVPYDPNVEVQLFEFAIGPKSYFAVDDASLAGDKQLSLDFMLTFLKNPFTIYNLADDEETITGERSKVVESMLAGELSAGYGLKERYQVGLALPVVFTMQGDGVEPATGRPMSDAMQISGLGDLRGEVKARVWEKEAMRLGGAVGLTLPSSVGSDGDSYLGDDLPSLRGRLAFNWIGVDNKLSLGANAGVIFRKPRTIYASEIGQQFTWGLAGAYSVTETVSVIGESFGRSGMTAMFDVDSSPMELGGGVRVAATKAVKLTVGGSAGVVGGIGTPDYRFFASVGYAPDTRDSDGDGVPNNRDKCMIVGEDKDGFDDADGCPDDDNDGDRHADGEDKCVTEAEDPDGFEDEDGCPELDNDGDGIADLQDRFCPLDKEDGAAPQPTDGCPVDKRDSDVDGIKDHLDACFDLEEDPDGFEDWDGCPDLDQDKDNVADDEDRCPVCTEDLDGFDDGDGCPEGDNDADGFADAKDKCPNEAEVINGIDDWDGCADEGGAELVTLEDDRLTFLRPIKFDKKGIDKAGKLMLDQAALIMMQHPEITSWAVAVSAKKDAAKRGEWVVRHLVGRGIEAARLQLVTSKGADAVGVAVMERADPPEEGAVPACPAGAEVTERSAPAAGAPSSTPDPTQPPPEDDLELD
jgi:hypothetical protein